MAQNLFFGYGSERPSVAEALKEAADRMQASPLVNGSVSWEELQIDGQLLASEIEAAIDYADVSVFDLTTLNQNVLYELGYAIGSNKRVFICLDDQDSQAKKSWSAFGLLRTTGYTGFKNAGDLVGKLSGALTDPAPPLLQTLLGGAASAVEPTRLMYVPSMKQDEPSVRVSQVLERYGKVQVSTVDLEDYGSSPLAWFAEEIYRSRWALFHFTPSRGPLAETMNPRVSFLAGLARGLRRGILLVSEEGEQLALDYADLSISYRSAKDIGVGTARWLESLQDETPITSDRVRTHISAELAALRFGNHVAENDQSGLSSYFVETRDYRNVIDSASVIFSGKKGTGKTANMLQAADELRRDARNLVCVIKPAGYELEGLLIVLARIDSRYLSDYLIEGLWKYLLYTEIASAAISEARAKPAGIRSGSSLEALALLLDRDHGGLEASFSVRLERLVTNLLPLIGDGASDESLERSRNAINAALYGGTLKSLRSHIIGAVDRTHVRVLIDNLDKAWERGADLESLSRLLLGLLAAVGRVTDEFHREVHARKELTLTLTVFIRSDIFAFIRDRAREPDKITVSEIEWRDPELLARILEDRFVYSRPGAGAVATDLWRHYFTHVVKGRPARDYVLSRVQARPRDLVFFANEIVARATNAQHDRLEESDILEAERTYSQFAYEALLVEGVASSNELEPILIEFSGEQSILLESEAIALIEGAEVGADPRETIQLLRQLGFLGLETTSGRFDFGGTASEVARADVLSKKYTKATRQDARYEIHPAYRAHLSISD